MKPLSGYHCEWMPAIVPSIVVDFDCEIDTNIILCNVDAIVPTYCVCYWTYLIPIDFPLRRPQIIVSISSPKPKWPALLMVVKSLIIDILHKAKRATQDLKYEMYHVTHSIRISNRFPFERTLIYLIQFSFSLFICLLSSYSSLIEYLFCCSVVAVSHPSCDTFLVFINIFF